MRFFRLRAGRDTSILQSWERAGRAVMYRDSGWYRHIVVICLALATAACAGLPRTDFTAQQQAAAAIPELPAVRTWADASLQEYARAGFRVPGLPADGSGRTTYLALSGGGASGAFGAGVLTGWTARGDRPSFTIVSGVSTGALTAPLAFLGPDYDSQLRALYTSGVAASLGQPRPLLSVLLGSHLLQPEPLRRLVEAYVDENLLRSVAREHLLGRRLFVVTTNLDAQRPVLWDMGAIAASGHPQALGLFQGVLIASATVPAFFPPVYITVEAGGQVFEEMHADGGITTQFFAVPEPLLASVAESPVQRRGRMDLYIIVNNNLQPEFEVVQPSTLSVVERAYGTFLKTHARGTLNATYAFARRAGMGFYLASIDLPTPSQGGPFNFDTSYMRALFDSGYRRALSGEVWDRAPPAAPADPGPAPSSPPAALTQ